MGHGTESRTKITIFEDDGTEATDGEWCLAIMHGPTMAVWEPFTDISLEVRTTDGRTVRHTIDPDAPTLQTLEELSRSESPILQALFGPSSFAITD